MNLTKLCVAGLCLSAMTASATIIATNSFETGAFLGVWTAPMSAITNVITGVVDTNTPMVGVGDTKGLKLDTEGSVWTNTVNQPYGGESNPAAVYADMLVKFVPSEELPDPAGLTGKLAIAVKADANGTNRLNYTFSTGSFGAWTPVTSKEVSTSVWHRLTVKLYAVGEDSKATVYLDNEQVHDGLVNGFTFNSIGFQGTGYIDEVVVRDDDPFGGVKFAGTYAITDPQEYTDWLTLAELDAGEETAAMYDAFLWNVKPDGTGSPLLKVGSIVIGETTVTLTVVANYPVDEIADEAIDVGNLNNGAQATVYGEATLEGATWTTAIDDSFDLEFAPGGSNFYKVKIQ